MCLCPGYSVPPLRSTAEFQELTEYAQEIMEAYTSAAPDGKIKLYAVADQLAGISDRLDAIAHIV